LDVSEQFGEQINGVLDASDKKEDSEV